MLVITASCLDVKDGICTQACPVDCIYEGERMFYIHPLECIECGMCESICPVDAIRNADELAPAETQFAAFNAAAFLRPDGSSELPGGWHKGLPPRPDPEAIAQLPRKERP